MPPDAVVGFSPRFAMEIGRVFWSIVIGEVLGRFIRSSGKLPPPSEDEEEEVGSSFSPELLTTGKGVDPVCGEPFTAAPRRPVAAGSAWRPSTQQSGNTLMAFDIVGTWDDDVGAIGLEELIGQDDDFLDELISGDVEDLLVSGDGSSEIIGASRGSKSKRAKMKAALKKLAMRNAGAVVSRGLDRRRRYPLGFVPTAIAAATTVQIPSAPQNLYRPERLVIPSDIAFDLGIADIKIGNQSQLVQSVEVPAALFSEVAINTGVTFDTAEVGNQVSVNARNKSAAALEFTAGLVGTIAK